ncbi:MAG: molybdopterin-dependent oxidoreductase [Coriobacteriales bacterium]|nr:molybdopterin-dependent oxidoreductase [Coriobacteriales bacterium]
MQATLTRRSFVKAMAAVGAATAVSTSYSSALSTTDKAWAATDSERTMYVSCCHGCIQVCPCKVYVENGVVVKIEGHPDGPTSQGSLCLKGLNQIHTCYSPRRVLYPLKRTGERGVKDAKWERISWDEAVELAASKIFEAIKKEGTYSFMVSVGGGGSYSFMQAMTLPMALGSPTVFEPGCAQCYLPRNAAAAYMYAGADQSIADCAVLEPFKGLAPKEIAKGVKPDTKVLVLWAAQPSVSQTAQSGRGMAELRAIGCKTIVVDPNFSPDAVKATIHLPVRPGSDAALILSWYRVILDEELYDKDFCRFFTNIPFLINPDTKLPWTAAEVFDGHVDPDPSTPAYVCYDQISKSVQPLPYGDPAVLKTQIDPAVVYEVEVKGKVSRTAGKVYRDEADPWTLEKTEEFCWVPADRIREAIDLYAKAEVAGIANGVASDMEETASQVPFGLMGLDMIMGYVNKPGATLTQNTPAAPGGPRPTHNWNGFSGMFGMIFGIGYQTGATPEQNEARIAAIPDEWDPSSPVPPFMTKTWLYALNQLMIDRLGMKNHKGLYEWCHSHIPTVREAIETGEPFHPRVWFDMSGNKFAMLGSAGAWYNAIMNGGVDFIICQYPMMTSFQIECADLMFPMEEWLEATGATEFGQLNYSFPCPGVIHLGETVPNTVPPQRVCNATAALLNDYIEQGNKVVFGFEGAKVGVASRNNGSYYHGNTIDTSKLRFPLGMGVMGGANSEKESWTAHIEKFKAFPNLAPKLEGVTDREGMLKAMANDPDFYGVTPPDMYWIYDQHLVPAADGLPTGFATESRKCEVYVQLAIKMGRTGFPYCYPIPQEAVDPSVATFDGDYSPICNVPKQKEVPASLSDPEGFAEDPSDEFPLALTSGRVYYFHHGTMRHAPFAREIYPVPDVRINPETAAKYGIAHGDWVEISSRRTQGEPYDPVTRQGTKTAEPIRGRAYVAEVVAPNVVWMERFWNPECFDNSVPAEKRTGGWQECNVNVITNAVDCRFNEVFGSYTNRGFAVNIKKSTKPDLVWTEPKEFAPFMPNNENQYTPADAGVAINNAALLTPIVEFNDPPTTMTGGF